MHRLLLQPRWLRAVALTLLASVVCLLLADWQLHRRAEKLAAIAVVTDNYSRRPAPLRDLLPTVGAPLDPAREWTPVVATGRYAPTETLLVRNRPQEGDFGYLVLVPLRLDTGDVLLVDRGWIPNGENATTPGRVPAPPAGLVTVVARLVPGEAADGRRAPQGQVQVIDLAGTVPRGISSSGEAGRRDAAQLLRGGYGLLASEHPGPTSGSPARADEPEPDEGPHLGYAVQWVVFAIGAWVFLVVHLRRAAYDADVAAGRRPPRAALVLADPHRRRSDEEIEDAAVDAFDRAQRLALRAREAALVSAAEHRPPSEGS